MPGVKGLSGGHNRKSGARKVASSTYRRDRVAQGPTPNQVAEPERPGWIDADPIAAEAWARICSLMIGLQTITVADRDAIVLACVAESEYRRAHALIESEGIVVDGPRGRMAHPATKVRESAWRRWATALAQLGLSPATRERVGKADVNPRASRFADL